MKRWIILAIIIAFVVAHRLFLKYLINKLAKQQAKTQRYFSDTSNLDDVRASTLESWKEAGLYRKPRKTVLKNADKEAENLLAEDSEETTELPKSLEEAFSGLENEEIEKILDEVLEEPNE